MLTVEDISDLKRCSASILDLRRKVFGTASAISVSREALPVLDDMQRFCLAYLNHVESTPEAYVVGLIALREKFMKLEEDLRILLPALVVRAPGAGDADPRSLFDVDPREA